MNLSVVNSIYPHKMNLSVVKQFLSEVKVHLSGLNSIYPHKMNLSVVKQIYPK